MTGKAIPSNERIAVAGTIRAVHTSQPDNSTMRESHLFLHLAVPMNINRNCPGRPWLFVRILLPLD